MHLLVWPWSHLSTYLVEQYHRIHYTLGPLDPYFSWRISHHHHHLNHSSMECDEIYVPKTCIDLHIPHKLNHKIEWSELFGDTPTYTLYMLMCQQMFAFPTYLCKVILCRPLKFF